MEDKARSALRYLMSELKRKGADDIALAFRKDRKTQIKFSNNNIVATKSWDQRYIAVMFAIRSRVITSVLENYSRSSIKNFAGKAISFSSAMPPNKQYMGIAEGPFRYKKPEKTFDKRVLDLGSGSIDIVESAINAALGEGAKRCNGVFEFVDSGENLLTSNNVEASDKGTGLYLSFRSHVKDDESGYSNQVCRMLSDLDPEKSGRDAAQYAVSARNPQRISAGKYDLIMDPYPFGDFLDHTGYSARISAVESGHSFLSAGLGTKVASDEVTVYDDGTYPGGLGTSKFDDEGVPTQRTTIIDKGSLKNYLHNTSTARRYNTKTTANAGLIFPANTNIMLKPGKTARRRMFEDFSGLHITNVWYMRFQNYLNGDFSTIPRDGIYLYKNGEMVKSAKGIRISDNMLRILKNVAGSTREQSQHAGWEVSGPVVTGSVKIKKVNITESTG